ncbi:M-phase phosphoprotein 8-like [Dysidea avara]|uniref:M-phase phosphoprotein 8-like n=1 Tax=Dysidea avara TaxID=196820 RepID=UPI00331AE852
MSKLYQVHSIRGHREIDGVTQYLVHWKKFNDQHDSWEPQANLIGCEEVIEEYKMGQERKAMPKRKTRQDREQDSKLVTPRRKSTRISAMYKAGSLNEEEIPTDSDADSVKDVNVKPKKRATRRKMMDPGQLPSVTTKEEQKEDQKVVEKTEEVSVPIMEEPKEKRETEKIEKQDSYSALVATGDFIGAMDDSRLLRHYNLRHRIQPMTPPVQPAPSTSILLSSDEEAEILSRRPMRKGRSPHRNVGVAPDPPTENYSILKSTAKYTVSIKEGDLLVRKVEQEATTKMVAPAVEDKVVTPVAEQDKASEPLISDVEEDTTETTTTTVSHVSRESRYPLWMRLNCAEFLLSMLITALLFITYWCWNSDVC